MTVALQRRFTMPREQFTHTDKLEFMCSEWPKAPSHGTITLAHRKKTHTHKRTILFHCIENSRGKGGIFSQAFGVTISMLSTMQKMLLLNIWRHLDSYNYNEQDEDLTFDFQASGVALPILDTGSTFKLTPSLRVVVDCCERYRPADRAKSLVFLEES